MSFDMTEEEQLQLLKKWWQKYHIVVITVISLIMLVIAGYRYWDWYHQKMNMQASSTYEHLMYSFSNKNNQDIKAYANQIIRDYQQTVYADAACMTLAKFYIEKEQYNKAHDLLEQVVISSRVKSFRQIAKIRLARLLITQKLFGAAMHQLSSVDDEAYMTIVNELKGDIFVATGHYDKAMNAYTKAIEEAKTHGLGNLFLEMKSNELAAIIHSRKIS